MADDMQNIQDTQGERSRRHDHRMHPQTREQARLTEKPAKSAESGLDDEETEEDRSLSPHRQHHGGRPEKKVYEEWENDPYCE